MSEMKQNPGVVRAAELLMDATNGGQKTNTDYGESGCIF